MHKWNMSLIEMTELKTHWSDELFASKGSIAMSVAIITETKNSALLLEIQSRMI